MKKKMTEGPFGLQMPDKQAKNLDALLKTLPKECRELRRKSNIPANFDLVPGERADVSLISVESIDREGDVVLAKGCDLTHFMGNPVVTMAHKYDELPVGKAAWVKAVPGGLLAKTMYATRPEGWDGPWLPDAVWSMTREGILKGKSIGFLPTRIRPPAKDEPQFKNAAAVVETSILLEYAVAPIPVNQDALVQAVAKGLTDEAMLKKLGLTLPVRKKTVERKKKEVVYDEAALTLKALEAFNIDPERIVRAVLHNLAHRGSV